MGWFDEQGTPDGGAIAPIEGGYDPNAITGTKGGTDPRPMIAAGLGMTVEELDAYNAAYPERAQAFNAGGKDVSTLPAIPSGPYHQTMNQGSSAASFGQPSVIRTAPGSTEWGTSRGSSVVATPATNAGTPNMVGVPGGTGAGQPSSAGGYQPFNEGVMRSILEKYTPDYAGVRRASEELDRVFGPGVVKLLDHPTKLDKFQLPNGQVIDTVIGAGGANPTWTWAPEGAGGGGAGGGGGLMGNGLSPQAQNFFNIAGQSYGAIGPIFGDPMAGRSLTDDPAFKFRLEEGRKALEASAAAKGTLLTGGTLKGLERFAQDYAGNEYQNSYARRASEQANNYNRLLGLAGFASGEQQNQYGRILGTAQLGLNGTIAGQNMASGYAGNIGNAQLAQGNAAAGATMAGAAGNAAAIGAIGNAGASWLKDYTDRDPNNRGGYIDVGRGLY